MNRVKLKNYAPQARRDFIQAVTDRAAYYGLTPRKTEPVIEKGDVALIGGRAFPRDVAQKRKSLEERISRHGFEQVMETMAYTWFNRLVAIRFMELHGYLDHGYRVLSHPEGKEIPEILEHAEHVDLPGIDRNKVIELKLEGTKEEGLYRMLLIAQCNALHMAMPFLFEWINDETELLLPNNLLHSDSLVRKLVNEIDEEDWQEVEIIGWFYQFYISEKKDEVIGKVVRSEDIPAATQLFTPNWIVKYMVQNTLGRKWLATYPNSPLRQQMAYYIEPAEQTSEVQTQLKAIIPERLNPEDITFLDDACGSGHILVEAYNLFKAIYQEWGYRIKDIPSLILQKNLFGLEICDRAAQLSAFALLMKARADDRHIFLNGVQPNVLAIQESKGLDSKGIANAINAPARGQQNASSHDSRPQDIDAVIDLFENAKTFGSLILIPQSLKEILPAIAKQIDYLISEGGLIEQSAAKKIRPLVEQARVLAGKYDLVVTNPPYMGNRYLNSSLKLYLKKHFDGFEKDMFASFIIRNKEFMKRTGLLGVMCPFVWMFIYAHEMLRNKLIENSTLTSLVQLEYSGFAEATVPVCTFTASNFHINGYLASFIRLSDFKGSEVQGLRTLEAIRNRKCGWFYTAVPDSFREIPGSPIAYWVSDRVRSVFAKHAPIKNITISDGQNVTGNNDKYVRLFWEVSKEDIGIDRRWKFYAKGGGFRRWAGNLDSVVDWSLEAREHYKKDPVSRIIPEYLWNEKGITWGLITSSLPSFRILQEGATFDKGGSSVFFKNEEDIDYVLAILNSNVALYLLRLTNPTLNCQVKNIREIPVSKFPCASNLKRNAQELVAYSQRDWDFFETSYGFERYPLLFGSLIGNSIKCSFDKWSSFCNNAIRMVKELEEENNHLIIEAYGLQEEISPEVPDDQITLTRPNREEDSKRLISYAIGCMMGRYCLDKSGLIYAHGGNKNFDPSQYQKFPADKDGIIPILEADWFPDDAANRFIEFIGVAWPREYLEENLKFIADSLGPNRGEQPRNTVRHYLAQSFFKDHLQLYKKRPIYWLFSSGKQRAFQCLVYLHRYHEGTLSRMRTEYVIPLQGKISSRNEQLVVEIQKGISTSHRKKLEKEQDTLKKQQAELQVFDESLRHYADMRISLDLDDGVKVNYGKFGDLLAEIKTVTGVVDE